MANVAKEDYWTIILNDPTKVGQITTLDEEFNRRVNNVNVVLSNTFINSSDENLISKWENSLYIDDTESKTLTERKADILYKLCVKNYVPVSIIKRFLMNLIGDENRFVVEFIKDENKLIVHTDRVDETQLETVTSLLESVLPQNIEVEQYNHHIEISWRDINTFANVATVEDMFAICPTKTDFNKYLTSDGEFCYPMPKANGIFSMYSKMDYFRNNGSLRKLNLYVPKDNLHWSCFTKNWNLTEAYVYSEKNTDAGTQFENCSSLKKITYIAPSGIKKFSNFARNCVAEEVEMTLGVNVMMGAKGAFSGCRLNKKSAVNILTAMCAVSGFSNDWGGNVATFGIHIDHQNDAEVLDAISNAEARGWSMEVQWNGTPTSTASTMAMGSLIYAKVGEHELPDGTTEQYLDWGHYVTNTEGYETFRSLESAYKYFNLEQPTEI